MAELTSQLDIAIQIGKKIRFHRKKRKMTIQQLADAICKGKSVVSKYETGQIAVDIVTLYDIANAIGVHVEQLLYNESSRSDISISENVPAFFKGTVKFYLYFFDGRNNTLNRSVINVLEETRPNEYKVMLYMNAENYEHYQNCENTYWGYLRHFDTLSSFYLHNRDNPMEQLTINFLASFLDTQEKWGLFMGISSRPLMPVALKALLLKTPAKESRPFLERLKISKEDLRIMKLYNMMTVIG